MDSTHTFPTARINSIARSALQKFPPSFGSLRCGPFLQLVRLVSSVQSQFRRSTRRAGGGRLINNLCCLTCVRDPEDQERCIGVGPSSAVAIVDVDSR